MELYTLSQLRKDLIKTSVDREEYARVHKKMRAEIQRELMVEAGEKIRVARCKAELSQQALASRIGTTKSNISRVERGNQNITLGYLTKVANALGKTVTIEIQ
ncbi:helix-turn-helix transcriptional regulator [Candidatus Dojkabacteria bacterium]|uniref:Helix-turn-helix transcriptional regulator n=1 Tax=Candidatus Dojkabacteria bacterium TaxID=2099670 RepID=A0A955I4K7_9BACT|nr:helix-turn-helix transcriptional regulator [Candidatus Dojkabacteria bacterium]